MSIFLSSEVRASQNIGWPIRIKELHNCTKELEVEGKADNLNCFSHELFRNIVFNSSCPLKSKNRDSDVRMC